MNLSDDTPVSESVQNGFDLSSAALIGANLIPLGGVLFFGWSVFEVVVLYWLENVIIGVINILKMLSCAPDPGEINLLQLLAERTGGGSGDLSSEQQEQLQKLEGMSNLNGGKLKLLNHASKLFFVPFFTFHYGIFCFVHGIFVFMLLGQAEGSGSMLMSDLDPSSFLELVQQALAAGGVYGALALAGSHLFSFFTNYIGKGEFRRTAVPMLMIAPYGRIVVLHLAIILGAFAVMALGSPTFLLVILVFGKIGLDWKFHRRAHLKLQLD